MQLRVTTTLINNIDASDDVSDAERALYLDQIAADFEENGWNEAY
ncbi:hypothetical protein ACTOVL_06235 [Arcanobacterium canis]